MLRMLLLALFCLSLCACGGGSGSDPATPQTSADKIAAYQGLYSGTIEYLDGRNGGGGGTVSFVISKQGYINFLSSNDLILPSYFINGGENSFYPSSPYASGFFGGNVDESGNIYGNQYIGIFGSNIPGQELAVSWNGTIDVSNGGVFDSTCTYSGISNLTFRIHGSKVQLAAQPCTWSKTLQTGQTAYLYNFSTSEFIIKNQYIRDMDSGALRLTSSWAITSAPSGSVARIIDGDWRYGYEKQFTPDVKGIYTITLTVTDFWGNTASSDMILSVI